MSGSPELEAKHAAYEAALRRYRELHGHARRPEEWQAAAEADRLRLEYYRARDAAGLSPMTDPLAAPVADDQFVARIRSTPRARRDAMSLTFNLVMPLLLFLGVGLPLLVYAFLTR